jgi:formamidopyrimidine-DNA glycosylase
MPEGPEVKRIAESLADRISSKTLNRVYILSGRYSKKVPDNFGELGNKLPIKIVGPGCHGKFIFWILENGWSLWNTLGMTGSWSDDRKKHSRIEFVLNDGSIFFNDQRNFGTIKIVDDRQELVEKLKSLGPDMLADNISDSLFISCLRKKNHKTISEAMMDQKVIAGVGNYIKADSLWLARISPHRKVENLTDKELSRLSESIQRVMKNSFQSGGATIRSYQNFDGSKGGYGERFLVYNRKVDPEGNEVIKEVTQDRRTTHWVPGIQI